MKTNIALWALAGLLLLVAFVSYLSQDWLLAKRLAIAGSISGVLGWISCRGQEKPHPAASPRVAHSRPVQEARKKSA